MPELLDIARHSIFRDKCVHFRQKYFFQIREVITQSRKTFFSSSFGLGYKFMNSSLLSFRYDRKQYKESFTDWLEIVDKWVESDELSPLIHHFHHHYEISPFAIKQHLKRTIVTAYDFVECSFKGDLIYRNSFKSGLTYLSALNYFLLFSSSVKRDGKRYKLMIDGIEDVNHELGAFSELIKRADFEIAFVSVNESNHNTSGKKIITTPFRKRYCRKSVVRALAIESYYGVKLYYHLSKTLGVDIFRLALSIINQYLYYFSLFSAITSEYCLTWRDYNTYSIKRDLFKKFGGKAVCAVQRSRHGYIPNGSFMDFDVYFPLGEWSTELCRNLKGRIGLSVPIGSLVCERQMINILPREKIFDLLYVDSILLQDNNLYEGYCEDHLETYSWLVEFSKANRDLTVAFAPRAGYPFPKETAHILKNSNVQILNPGESYKEAAWARVITTYYSTMGFELLGDGFNLVFCNPRSRCNYLPYDTRFKMYKAESYEEFNKKVRFLMSDNNVEIKKYLEGFWYYCKPSRGATETILNTVSK